MKKFFLQNTKNIYGKFSSKLFSTSSNTSTYLNLLQSNYSSNICFTEVSEFSNHESNIYINQKNSVADISSIKELLDKYFVNVKENSDSKNEEINKIVREIGKRELFKKDVHKKYLEMKLKVFTENCIKYNLLHYLDSDYFFKSNKYNFLLDSFNLEKEFQKLNINSTKKVLLSELTIKNKYKELKKEFSDNKFTEEILIPENLEKNHKACTGKYLNFLSTLSSVKKSYDELNFQEENEKKIAEARNEKLLVDYDSDYLVLEKKLQTLFLKEFYHLKNKSIKAQEKFFENISDEKDKILLSPENLKSYPGNSEGPLPEHDPNHFYYWFKNNHSKEVIEALDRQIEKSFKKNYYSEKRLLGDEDQEIKEDNKQKEKTTAYDQEDQDNNTKKNNFIDKNSKNQNKKFVKDKISHFNDIVDIFIYTDKEDYFLNKYNIVDIGGKLNLKLGSKPTELFEDNNGENCEQYFNSMDSSEMNEFFDTLGDEYEFYEIQQKNNFSLLGNLPPKIHYNPHMAQYNTWDWQILSSNLYHENVKRFKLQNISNLPDLPFSQDNTFCHKVFGDLNKNFNSQSLHTMMYLYPKASRDLVVVKNAIQILTKSYPHIPFKSKAEIVDTLCGISFNLAAKDLDDGVNMTKNYKPYARTIKNIKYFAAFNWATYRKRTKSQYGGEETETDDEETLAGRTMLNKIEEEREEEERQMQKELEAKEKREAEAAKNAGKEAYDAYKKKIEDEKKAKEKEEMRKEMEEEVFEEKDEVEEAESNKRQHLKALRIGIIKKEELLAQISNIQDEEEREEELDNIGDKGREGDKNYDESGRPIIDWEQIDDYDFTNPFDFYGIDDTKKHVLEGGIPEIRMNENVYDDKRLRFLNLYKKVTKFLSTPEEEQEFEKLLSTKDTDPELYSYITGIPLEEISQVKEQAKTFTNTYFKNTHNLSASEAELQILEQKISRLTNQEEEVDEDDDDDEDYTLISMQHPLLVGSPFLQKIPIDYYDNDDGFWDDYIDSKIDSFDVRNLKERPLSYFYENIRKKEEN